MTNISSSNSENDPIKKLFWIIVVVCAASGIGGIGSVIYTQATVSSLVETTKILSLKIDKLVEERYTMTQATLDRNNLANRIDTITNNLIDLREFKARMEERMKHEMVPK